MTTREIIAHDAWLLSPVGKLGLAFAVIGRAIRIKQVGGRRLANIRDEMRWAGIRPEEP